MFNLIYEKRGTIPVALQGLKIRDLVDGANQTSCMANYTSGAELFPASAVIDFERTERSVNKGGTAEDFTFLRWDKRLISSNINVKKEKRGTIPVAMQDLKIRDLVDGANQTSCMSELH